MLSAPAFRRVVCWSILVFPVVAEEPSAVPDAATPAAVQGMTLAEARARAMVSNRALRTARSVLFQARLGRTAASTTVFAPVMTASYTAVNDNSDVGQGRVAMLSKALGFEIEPYMRMGYNANQRADGSDQYVTAGGVNISRYLFNVAEHLRQRLPLTQAEIAVYQAANRLVLAGRDLDRQVTEAFFAVQASDARLSVRERRYRDARAFLDNVRDRIAHGLAARLDELNAESDLNQAEADLNAERSTASQTREDLSSILDRPVSVALQVVAENVDDAARIPDRDVDADVRVVLDGHEDLGSRARDAQLLGEQLRIQRDQVRPQVKATVNAERAATGPGTFDGSDTLGNRFALTLAYSMPLDGWTAEQARYDQIELQIADQQRAVAELRSNLERQLRNAFRAISQQRRQVALSVRRLEIMRSRLDATLREYESGTSTAVGNLEVTRAKGDLASAELGLLSARIALVVADAQYRALLPVTVTPVSAEAPESASRAAMP